MEFGVSDELRSAAPEYKALIVTAKIDNPPTPDALWSALMAEYEHVASTYEMPMVIKREAIATTRAAYKACGKEPNRYRPSAEALMRRMVRGLDLYRTLTAIDLINLLSVETGHSIGGFDADAISGDVLTLGIGREGEPYEAIGRGPLHIAGMPVWRDAVGGIGTPTSDNDRTKLSESTRNLLMIINMYGLEAPVEEVEARAVELLRQYAAATDIRVTRVE